MFNMLRTLLFLGSGFDVRGAFLNAHGGGEREGGEGSEGGKEAAKGREGRGGSEGDEERDEKAGKEEREGREEKETEGGGMSENPRSLLVQWLRHTSVYEYVVFLTQEVIRPVPGRLGLSLHNPLSLLLNGTINGTPNKAFLPGEVLTTDRQEDERGDDQQRHGKHGGTGKRSTDSGGSTNVDPMILRLPPLAKLPHLSFPLHKLFKVRRKRQKKRHGKEKGKTKTIPGTCHFLLKW
jgi:hypothetical protein